jgi:hypothetical protein
VGDGGDLIDRRVTSETQLGEGLERAAELCLVDRHCEARDHA